MGKKRIITKEGGGPDLSKSANGAGSKKSKKRQVVKGMASISSSYNNTIVTISDRNGETLAWSSSGSIGFKGTRKSTPYAATLVAQNAAEKAKQFGVMEIIVVVRGIGPGREAAIRGLISAGMQVQEIHDETPIAHNGVRPKKARRV